MGCRREAYAGQGPDCQESRPTEHFQAIRRFNMTFLDPMRWLLAGLLALAPGGLAAQALDFPTRPVTIVVPFAAGGGTDILGRLVAQQLEQRLGRPFIIENKPGAGSTTGAGLVARANPDGYTLLMAPSPTMAVAI